MAAPLECSQGLIYLYFIFLFFLFFFLHFNICLRLLFQGSEPMLYVSIFNASLNSNHQNNPPNRLKRVLSVFLRWIWTILRFSLSITRGNKSNPISAGNISEVNLGEQLFSQCFLKIYLCAECCHVSVNMHRVNLVGVKFLLYSSSYFTHFWMMGRCLLVAFGFEKQNNMSFVKSVFHFLIDFILGAQTKINPKSVYRCHNWPKILFDQQ